jgi:hypothetical protein
MGTACCQCIVCQESHIETFFWCPCAIQGSRLLCACSQCMAGDNRIAAVMWTSRTPCMLSEGRFWVCLPLWHGTVMIRCLRDCKFVTLCASLWSQMICICEVCQSVSACCSNPVCNKCSLSSGPSSANLLSQLVTNCPFFYTTASSLQQGW